MPTTHIEFKSSDGLTLRYVYPDHGRTTKPAKWVCYKDIKGVWRPLRKPTPEDIQLINKTVAQRG
jgi:hypothetical protein